MQYVNSRMGQVASSGGTLTLDLGDPTKGISASENYFALVGKAGETGKTSSWFYADGTAGNNSEIVWNSKNTAFLGYYPASAVGGQEVESTQRFQVPVYAGMFKVTDVKGNTTTHTVTDVASLGVYNNWVIDQLKKGNLTASSYNTVLSYGYSYKTEESVYKSSSLVTAGDEVTLAPGTMALAQADGENAKVRLTREGDIEAKVNNSNIIFYGSSGGTIVNDGVLSGFNSGTSLSAISALVKVDTGGHFENNGLMNVGFLTNGNEIDTSTPVDMFTARGVLVGANSSVDNTGIINVGSANQARQNLPNQLIRGITLNATGSKGTNSGTINVAVNVDGFSPLTTGVELIGKSSFGVAPEFTNNADGEIYIGRTAQYLSGAGGKDIPLIGSIGVMASGASKIKNAGKITIGAETQGAVGIKLTAGATGTNTETGVINVNSAVLGLQNLAVQAGDGSKFTHNGTINLNGVNQVGLKATTENLSGESGRSAKIIDAGIVNINGSMGTEGVRSYGLMAEGAGSLIDMQGGEINLNGDGGIGAYAIDGGRINIAAGSNINFNSGVNGIGFFAFGEGATINIGGNQPLDISIDDSTLIRIDSGSTLATQPNQKLIASGKNSTALVVSGENSHANMDSLNFAITGEKSTAVRVEGGARGEMSGASQLALSDKTTAVVIDNIRYDVNGVAVGRGDSLFTNTADIYVNNAKSVVLFNVNNGAKLINTGNIELSDGTAIVLSGVGSTVSPDTAGQFGSITVNDGNAGIQVAKGATLNTSASITVDGSASALLVNADAGRVVLNEDAHLTGKSGGYGNIITNQSSSGNVLVDGATIEMSGSGAALLSENNIDSLSHGYILVSSNTGGKGIALSAADGSRGEGSLEVSDNWKIDVLGDGSGVYSNTTGSLVVSGVIDVSGTGNAVKSDATDILFINPSAVLTGQNSKAVLVSGTLNQMVNSGQILAHSVTDMAVELSDSDEILINTGNSKTSGVIHTGAGNDTVLFTDNSLHNGILKTGDGDDTVTIQGNNVSVEHLEGGAGHNTFILSNVTQAVADEKLSKMINGFQSIHLSNATILDLQRDFWEDDLSNRATIAGRTLDIDESSRLTISNDQRLTADVNNSGNIAFLGNRNTFAFEQNIVNSGMFALNANRRVGDTLQVNGDYHGNGGEISFDVVLNGDTTSPGDQMIVEGNTSGITKVLVTNTGGNGARTVEGIKLITVNGASTGDFIKKGRIVAGAYDYDLVRGQGMNSGNWYLTSSTGEPPVLFDPEPAPTTPDVPVIPEVPAIPDVPVIPDVPEMPGPVPAPIVAQVRPEAAAYVDNLYAAYSLFNITLQDRMGGARGVDSDRNEQSGLWLRQTGEHLRSRDSSGQNNTRSNRYVTQLGSDVVRWSSNGQDRWLFGVMAGYV
ncbi:autotransporter outer membrane beta-barrel domain-containing protein [Citrobacter sp. wls613]|uniref:autotransporter outer membrane beta-barrel domain-containing protein n=1 Tax=Citrobacter sp. wls613 TaxID=2576436 RepID=UPI0010CA6885|nr:autotransporter outer membrane beta-barrel domain-containing protein [Citrobacter sp. wls613]TKV21599.1 autotransporter outer membrane beta-barrel domain-containing protein [Citrobacter sp. wls613]